MTKPKALADATLRAFVDAVGDGDLWTDVDAMPSIDHFTHYVESRRKEGETFEAAEFRLRREA